MCDLPILVCIFFKAAAPCILLETSLIKIIAEMVLLYCINLETRRRHVSPLLYCLGELLLYDLLSLFSFTHESGNTFVIVVSWEAAWALVGNSRASAGCRTEHAQRSLQEKELAVSDKDRLLADLQRQVADLQARSSGEPVKADASVPLVRPGNCLGDVL